jgi:hypothetical protein
MQQRRKELGNEIRRKSKEKWDWCGRSGCWAKGQVSSGNSTLCQALMSACLEAASQLKVESPDT